MQKRYVVATYRAFFGFLTVVAIIAQCAIAIDSPTFSLVNFFSYFTIQSNILAALILFISAWGAWNQKRNNTFALLRGAAVLYMVTTGIVYGFLLSGIDVQVTGWINVVLHYVMPAVLFGDWLVDRPLRRIKFKDALVWLAFPAAYLVYSLMRGARVDWYPYPFLNPAIGGYVKVALSCVLIATTITGLTWVLARYTRPRNAKS